ncbi:MAG: hypothetical protein EOP10_15340 [Proteobacteria bacterium]|nr:MAG: hypothetical protein EOP10_15340 [Pseudomonadota bacterium]
MGSPGKFFLLILFGLSFGSQAFAVVLPKRDQVLKKAQHLLDTWTISYVYGGNKLSDPKTCQACNACLDLHKSDPKERLSDCPVCNDCSLDCSHYTFEVFKQAGLHATYLTTALMNDLPPDELAKKYNLLDIGRRIDRAMPGDLLVYNGHVVLLEKKGKDGRGDVIHVTSGRDLRGPGHGIQRERQAMLASFRGPVLRILRHLDLAREMRDFYIQQKTKTSALDKPAAISE